MIIELFATPFPSKRKPSKCPTKEEKNGERKATAAGRRESKR